MMAKFCTYCLGPESFFTQNTFTLAYLCLKELLEHSCSWFAAVKGRRASVHSRSVFLAGLKNSQPESMYFPSWWSAVVSHLTQFALLALFSAVCECRGAFSHACYLVLCFLVPSLCECLCFSVPVSQNGSTNPLGHLRGKAQLHYCTEWMHFLIHVAEWEII